uniref:Uncharacterized protein n=1 Tax=Arundo donax TaxID=35708 RepID=A0A0A8ZDY1_ARUDO
MSRRSNRWPREIYLVSATNHPHIPVLTAGGLGA